MAAASKSIQSPGRELGNITQYIVVGRYGIAPVDDLYVEKPDKINKTDNQKGGDNHYFTVGINAVGH
jgi:hypothetical protein